MQERSVHFRIAQPLAVNAENSSGPVLFDGFVLWIRLAVDAENVVDSLADMTNWDPVYFKLTSQPILVLPGDEIVVRVKVDVASTNPTYSMEATLPSGRRESVEWNGAL